MRNILTLLFAGILSVSLFGQIPLVQVTDINDPTPSMLANCNDTSSYYLDTVTVVGYVVTAGNLSEVVSSSINGANGTRPFIWINDTANGGAVGPFTGLEVMGVNWNTSQATAGFTNLLSGDLVQITGVVGMFSGATQFQPLDNNSIQTPLGINPTFTPAQVQISELNDQNQINNLVTGEKWQGAFVEVKNVTVTNVNQFGSGTSARVEFTVADSAGNSMQVYDFFLAQHLPTWTTKNPNSPASTGSFTPPSVGTFYNSLKGVIEHSGNGCTGGTGQGYRLHPFDSTHYEVGKSVPNITNVKSVPAVPSSSDPIVVNADVIDSDGSIDSVHIFWTASPTAPIGSFNKAMMTLASGITYTYTIPAQPNNTVVRYYIRAVDNDTSVSLFPRTPVGQSTNTANIFVRDGGLSIVDVQKPLAGGASSPFDGQRVTVKGFVTAAQRQCDLGHVYIQDSSATEYAGLALRSSLNLANLYRNQYVEASGTIQESFGFTQMLIDSVKSLGSSYQVQPIELDPSDSVGIADYEKYESMLVTFKSPDPNGQLYVVNGNLGFGEYAIASMQSTSNPDAYRRVLAGRDAGTNAQSSLYVQLVSDSVYATLDGSMFYTPIEAKTTMTMDAMTGIMWYSFGNFKLTPRNNNDIEGLSVQLDTSGCTTPYFSISEVNELANLNMYPNPASTQVTISGYSDDIQVAVYDLKGTLVKTAKASRNTELTLDIANVKPGLYLVRVSGKNADLYGTYKLIVTQ